MSISAHDLTLSVLSTEAEWFVDVVRAAQTGNIAAFDMLYQRYNARICTYLARMVGNDEEGRDLTQETFIKVWHALAKIHDATQFESWLYRIATNTAIDHLRQRKSRWPLLKNSDEVAQYMRIAGPEVQVEEAELIKLALAQLSPQYRACLLLQHVAGFSQREIAKAMNLSEKSISIYISRGCEQFRQAYERLSNGKESNRRAER